LDSADRSPLFKYAIVNGERRLLAEAQISIFNQALLSSFGVYEAIKIEAGRPFYLEEHLHRLFQSAAMLGLSLGRDVPTLARWFGELNRIDPQATWRLTIVAIGAVEAGVEPIVAMRPEPLRTYPARFYQEGATAVLYEGQRALPACKSLNTLVNFLARRAATESGSLEGVLHHNGYLTEGARSNLFAVRQGRLFTPPATEVLSGITRDVILQVMEDTPYPVVEAPLPTDLSLYEEIFISSTSMHVMPLNRIDGQSIGLGRVGPITKVAMARFETHYRAVMEP
jgi:branched-subunit amino acid aminotransferase/4-amino-4-deoxychorismate lyase